MSICGIHIGREYITLARRDGAERGVDSIGIQPLGVHNAFHDEVSEGFKEMAEKNLFLKKEAVVISLDSSVSHSFLTTVPSEINDMHEMMSWELMVRVNDPISHYAFDAVPAGPGKAIGVAVREEEIHFFKKLCKKYKLQLKAVDIDLLSIFNIYDLNYDSTTPALLLSFDMTSITIIFVQNKTIHALANIAAIDDNQSLDAEIGRILTELESLLNNQGISKGVPIYITGEVLGDYSIREVLLKSVPDCSLLNPFEKLPSRAGMDEDSIERYAPLVSVAVGLSQKDI